MENSHDAITFLVPKDGFGLSEFPADNLRRLGILYCGKVAAEYIKATYNQTIVNVLYRAKPHGMTYNINATGFTMDDFHLTFDLKTKEMATQHYTVHVNIKESSPTDGIDKMFEVKSVTPKTNNLDKENDSYFDRVKNKQVNNWDPQFQVLVPIAEPQELRGMANNAKFEAVVQAALSAKYKEDLDKTVAVATATGAEKTDRSTTKAKEKSFWEAEAKKKADEDAKKKAADEAKIKAGASTQGTVPKN